MIKRFRAWLRDRRIKRFKRQFAEAYPDGAKFVNEVLWLNGKKEYIIDAKLHVDDVVVYHQLTPEEEQMIKDSFRD